MKGQVAIAVLAAGRASRFGGDKLDAPCAGKPLGQWVLDAVAAAGASPGLLVTGPTAPAFAVEAGWDGWTLLTNPNPEDGLAGSVALAACHAEHQKADALLLLLADMPLVSPATIGEMLEQAPATMPLAMRYPGGYPGVPARFPASLFGALAALTGDRGGAALLAGGDDTRFLDLPPDALIDVDDRAGLARAEALLRSQRARG